MNLIEISGNWGVSFAVCRGAKKQFSLRIQGDYIVKGGTSRLFDAGSIALEIVMTGFP